MSFFSFLSRLNPHNGLKYITHFSNAFPGSFSESMWEDAFNITKSGQEYFCFTKSYYPPKVDITDEDELENLNYLKEKLKNHQDSFSTSNHRIVLKHFHQISQFPNTEFSLNITNLGYYTESKAHKVLEYTKANYTNGDKCPQTKRPRRASVYYLCDPTIPENGQITSVEEKQCKTKIFYFTPFACHNKENAYQQIDGEIIKDAFCIPNNPLVQDYAKMEKLYKKIIERKEKQRKEQIQQENKAKLEEKHEKDEIKEEMKAKLEEKHEKEQIKEEMKENIEEKHEKEEKESIESQTDEISEEAEERPEIKHQTKVLNEENTQEQKNEEQTDNKEKLEKELPKEDERFFEEKSQKQKEQEQTKEL